MLNALRVFTDRILYIASVWLLLSMLFCVVAGVVSRQLNAPLAWTDELAQYLLVWMGFCGWMIASRKRSHIRITVLVDVLPTLAARITEIVTQIAIIFFGAGLIWHSYALIKRTLDVESISLPLPAAILYFPLPVLGSILMVQAMIDIAVSVRGPVQVDGGQVL